MSTKKSTTFGVIIGLALFLGMAGSVAADTSHKKALQARSSPLPLKQALRIPNLQPSSANIPATLEPHTTPLQHRSAVLNNWEYEVGYKYTKQGWRLESYAVSPAHTHTTEANEASTAIPGRGGSGDAVLNLVPAYDSYPPNAPYFKPQNPPEHPDDPNHHEGSRGCPYFGTNYDLNVSYKWVPAKDIFDDDGNFVKTVPGHWELEFYNVRIHPHGPFCK